MEVDDTVDVVDPSSGFQVGVGVIVTKEGTVHGEDLPANCVGVHLTSLRESGLAVRMPYPIEIPPMSTFGDNSVNKWSVNVSPNVQFDFN